VVQTILSDYFVDEAVLGVDSCRVHVRSRLRWKVCEEYVLVEVCLRYSVVETLLSP
jgi:hypothetical protein